MTENTKSLLVGGGIVALALYALASGRKELGLAAVILVAWDLSRGGYLSRAGHVVKHTVTGKAPETLAPSPEASAGSTSGGGFDAL